MLERDLTDWARAREEHAKSGRGGVLTPDVTHCYRLQYRTAFGAIGGAEVIALMKGYLPDLRFGSDAACALMDIWKREHPSDRDKPFAAWHDFSEVKARRKQREDTQHPMPTCDFAEAIFEVIRELGTHDKDDAAQRQAIGLAKIGLGLPHRTKRHELHALLILPQQYTFKQGLLTAAAMAGEIIPADTLLAGTRELLDLAERESWRLDENRGELMGWVELFPFSDRPSAVLDALELLPAEYCYAWQLRRLLSALGDSPHPDALPLAQARHELASWREDYNTIRPHSSLGQVTPAAYAELSAPWMQRAGALEQSGGSEPQPVAPQSPIDSNAERTLLIAG